MINLGSLSAVWTTSLLLSTGFARSCEFPPDDPGDDGGSSSGVAGAGVAGAGVAGAGGAGAGVAGAGVAGAGGACVGASDTSCAGMPGSAGASGNGVSGAGSGGSNGDPSLPLLVSTQLINLPSTHCGTVPTSSQAFTITNPSSVTKTWTSYLSQSLPFFSVEPTGSSLPPGQVVTVTATPLLIPAGSIPNGSSPLMRGAVVISEHPNDVIHSINVSQQIAGPFFSWSPANLNFGVVRLNTSLTLPITQSGDSSGRLSGDNPAFVPSALNPQSWHEWNVTFFASAVGTQTATFTWQSFNDPIACTPNTFTATATVQAGPVQ